LDGARRGAHDLSRRILWRPKVGEVITPNPAAVALWNHGAGLTRHWYLDRIILPDYPDRIGAESRLMIFAHELTMHLANGQNRRRRATPRLRAVLLSMARAIRYLLCS